MAELGLKKKEVDAIEFAFDVYDFKGDGKVDAFYAGDLIRACNLNPTLKTIEEIGGTKEKGQKMLTKAEVFPMYKACKDSKDQGGFHDFVEILKLYDKNDDNTMLAHELFRLLTNLGEKLTKEEAKSLMKELCEPADDEGFMPFIRKFSKLHININWKKRKKDAFCFKCISQVELMLDKGADSNYHFDALLNIDFISF